MLKGLLLAASGTESWRKMLKEEGLPWVQLNRKEPEAFLQALEQLQAEKEEVLCLVETGREEALGKELGLFCVGYLNPEYQEEDLSGCEMLLEGLEEVDRVFLEEVHARALGLPVQIAETKHLIIREACLQDLDVLTELYRENPSAFLKPEFCGPREEEEKKLRTYLDSMYGLYHFGLWVVIEKNSGKLIGRVGFGIAEYLDSPEVDLGYLIAGNYRGKGYAKEACRAVLAYAQERLAFTTVSAYIDRENVRSLRLIEKLGFFRKQEFTYQGRTLWRYQYTFAGESELWVDAWKEEKSGVDNE